MILAGHDISAGGFITTLLEMTFADDTPWYGSRSRFNWQLTILFNYYSMKTQAS